MRLLAVLACWGILASTADAQILIWGWNCNPTRVPGQVRNLNIVINRYGDGGRINFKQPKGDVCVNYYEVRMVETGPTPRAVADVPSQTKETSVKVKGLRPGQEYLVTVTAVNGRGRGDSVQQTVIPMRSTNCDRKPAAVKDLTAQYVDAKTMTLQWQPGDQCYIGAEVEVVEALTNKQVYKASVADAFTKVSGLTPRTSYKVTVVPYAEKTAVKGPPTTVTTSTPCDPTLTPGYVTGLVARAASPAGTVLVDVKGVSNDACVASWEFSARGQGHVVGNTVKITDPSNPAVTGIRLNGRANMRYTIQVTAVSPSGKKGITGQIGPVLADGRTQAEAGGSQVMPVAAQPGATVQPAAVAPLNALSLANATAPASGTAQPLAAATGPAPGGRKMI